MRTTRININANRQTSTSRYKATLQILVQLIYLAFMVLRAVVAVVLGLMQFVHNSLSRLFKLALLITGVGFMYFMWNGSVFVSVAASDCEKMKWTQIMNPKWGPASQP
jgi:hypothetical protein